MPFSLPRIFSPPEEGVFTLKYEQGEQSAIDYLTQSVKNFVFSINSSYFHSDEGCSPLFSYPSVNLLRRFGELGFDFDTPASLGAVKDQLIQWLNQRGLNDDGLLIDDKTSLAAFRVLGEFSHSAEMVNQVEKSKFLLAKQAFKEGRQEAFSRTTRQVEPHLISPLAQIVAQCLVGDPQNLSQ